MSPRPEIVVDGKNELGEGVVWSPTHGEVQWTDILGRRFFAYRPSDGAARSVALPDRLACFAPLGATSLLAGFAGGLEVFDLKSGARRPIAAIEPDRPTTRVNDGKLDRQGRLVFGTMDEDANGARPIGQIYTYEGGLSPRALVSGVRIANSIAFSPDGRRMYFADTPTKVIRAYDYDLDSGDLSGERTFAVVQGPGSPDGSTVDADGCLWNAEWGGGRVVRYTPDGRVDRAVALPCAQVTCCAFGGAGLDRLFITTARTGLDAAALAGQPHAGALFAIDGGVTGLADTPFPAARLPFSI
jgi:L-arabinonolactonase